MLIIHADQNVSYKTLLGLTLLAAIGIPRPCSRLCQNALRRRPRYDEPHPVNAVGVRTSSPAAAPAISWREELPMPPTLDIAADEDVRTLGFVA